LRTFRIWSMKLLTIPFEEFRRGHLRSAVTHTGLHIRLQSMGRLLQRSKIYN